jgi:hypothetical protein
MCDKIETCLGKARRLGIVQVVHAVPDRLENPDTKVTNPVIGKTILILTKQTG